MFNWEWVYSALPSRPLLSIFSPNNNGILELTTSDSILAWNRLLTPIVDKQTKQLSKLPQKLKKVNESPQQGRLHFMNYAGVITQLDFTLQLMKIIIL